MATIDQLIGRQLGSGAIPFGNDEHLLFSHDPVNLTWDNTTKTLHAKLITADSISVVSLTGTLDVPNYTLAGLPVAGNAGRVALVTDDVGGLFVDTGSVWQSATLDHTLLGDFHSDAPTASLARGDILRRNATNQWSPLAIGAAGSLLKGGTDPAWFARGAQGSLLRADAGDISWLSVGGAGAILNSNGSDPAWLAKGAQGGILRANAADISYLAVGGAGAILRSDGSDPVYLAKGARGGLLRADAGDISYLSIGGAGSLLTTDGTDPSWLALAARGGILRSNASSVSFLALGTTGHYLTAGANDPEWTALPSFTPSIITTKGDLIAGNASNAASRLAVGVTNDMVLAVDSGQAHGIKWMTLSAYAEKATLTAKGDIYVATGSATLARKAVGVDGQVLKADSAQADGLAWGDVSGATLSGASGLKVVPGEPGTQGTWVDSTTTYTPISSGFYNIFTATVNSGYIIGDVAQFSAVNFIISVGGSMTTIVYQYWNGSAWSTLTTTATPLYNTIGYQQLRFTVPGDWALGGSGTGVDAAKYNIRVRVTAGPAVVTARASLANKVDVTADEVIAASGLVKVLTQALGTISPDIRLAGSIANGRDQAGAFSANSYVYLWLIYNGTTWAGLWSASATAPTMPTGYTYKVLIGGYRIDANSILLPWFQFGKNVTYPVFVLDINGGTATSATAFTLTVPGIAILAQIRLATDSGGTSVVYGAEPGSVHGQYYLGVASAGPTVGPLGVPIKIASTGYYYVNSGNANIATSGYIMPGNLS